MKFMAGNGCEQHTYIYIVSFIKHNNMILRIDVFQQGTQDIVWGGF